MGPPVRGRGYAHHVEIEVPVERVWEALTHPPVMQRWIADRAIVEPRAGGRYFVERKDRGARDAQIDIFEPNRRLRLVYLKTPGAPRTDNVLIDDFLLDSKGTSTVLRILGSGIPDLKEWDPIYARLRLGWPILFTQLRLMLTEAREPGATQPAKKTEVRRTK